jgi:hypothetical protein
LLFKLSLIAYIPGEMCLVCVGEGSDASPVAAAHYFPAGIEVVLGECFAFACAGDDHRADVFILSAIAFTRLLTLHNGEFWALMAFHPPT